MSSQPLITVQDLREALRSYGPNSRLTSFTALHGYGVRGWERPEIHLVAPPGTERVRRRPGSPPVVLHLSNAIVPAADRLAERCSTATVRAATSLRSARQACGLVATVVQLAGTDLAELREAALVATGARHRRSILTALADMGLGEQALAGIDFDRLCRLYELPGPMEQFVRPDPAGRRRHLHAAWQLTGATSLAIEVDAALQLAPPRWWADRLPPFVAASSGSIVLRCPSAVARHEPHLLLAPLRRALQSSRAA